MPQQTRRFLSSEFGRLKFTISISDMPVLNTVAISQLEYFSEVAEDLYSFIIRVDGDGSPGGTNVLERLLVDKEGRILYGKDKDPYSFQFGWAKKEQNNNDILVDIITEVPSRHAIDQTGKIETFAYTSGKLQKIGSKTIDLYKYWNP